MLDILGMIKELAGATRAVAEKSTQSQKLNNSPEVQAAKKADNLQKEKEAGREAIADENLKDIQKRWSN